MNIISTHPYQGCLGMWDWICLDVTSVEGSVLVDPVCLVDAWHVGCEWIISIYLYDSIHMMRARDECLYHKDTSLFSTLLLNNENISWNLLIWFPHFQVNILLAVRQDWESNELQLSLFSPCHSFLCLREAQWVIQTGHLCYSNIYVICKSCSYTKSILFFPGY